VQSLEETMQGEDETMTGEQPPIEALARAHAATAAEAYADLARYLRALPVEAWGGRSGCSAWTIRDLAGHVVGEAVWFPILVRGVTRGERPLPTAVYEALKTLPATELADRLEQAAREIPPAVAEATPAQLQQRVDVGWTTLPLWRATALPVMEAVYHHWDARAGREPEAAIPTSWAVTLAELLVEFAPLIAHRDGAVAALGRYLFQVGDGVGAMTVAVQDGQVRVERGARGTPDVTLQLSADRYARLLAGRLDLARALDRGEVQLEGERDRALALTRVFAGIG
jgi:uncharacterized protein (TIGR03083 family)